MKNHEPIASALLPNISKDVINSVDGAIDNSTNIDVMFVEAQKLMFGDMFRVPIMYIVGHRTANHDLKSRFAGSLKVPCKSL